MSSDRGEGEMRRSVLQVFSKEGALLAEHDSIHEDPVYASYFLRERVKPEWLKIWAESQAADIQCAGPVGGALAAKFGSASCGGAQAQEAAHV